MTSATSTPVGLVGSGSSAKRNLSLTPSEMMMGADNKKSRPHQSLDMSFIPELSGDTNDDVSASSKLSQHDITTISNHLKTIVLAEIQSSITSAVEAAVESLVPKVVNNINQNLLKELNSIKTENNSLKAQVSELEARVDHSEQYSRRNSLRISGMKEDVGESTDEIVLAMVSSLGGSITIDEIDRSHRVGKRYTPGPSQGSARPSRPRDIIVKFTSYRSRQKLLSVRARAKGNNAYDRVFINEDLSRARSNVFFKARLLARKGQIQSAWTSDGTILLRDNDMNIHRVTQANELARFDISTFPQQQSYATALMGGPP